MRKNLALTLVLTLALCVQAFTQERAILDVTDKPTQLRDLVKKVVEGSGYTVEGLENIPETETWKGRLVVQNLKQALETILTPSGHLASMDNWVVRINRKTAAAQSGALYSRSDPDVWTAEDQARYGSVPRDTDARSYRISQQTMRGMYGDAYMDQHMVAERTRQMYPSYVPPQPIYGGSYGSGGGYYNSNYGYDPYGYGAQAMARTLQVQGAATTGWLKLYAQGDTDFVKYLVVLRRVGSTYVPACAGGKAFRIFHDPCEVPVGLHTYRFEVRKDGKSQFYEEDIEMFSKYNHEHPFQYTISSETFRSWQHAEGMRRVTTWK